MLALRAFQATAHLLPTGELDAATVEGLGEIVNHPFVEHTVEPTAAHHAIESIAERFHTTPAFIRELNGDRTIAAGERIRVPNAVPAERPMKNWWRTERAGGSPHVTVEISKAEQAVRVNVGGWTHFYAPFAVAAGHQQRNWSEQDQASHRCLEMTPWDAERVSVLAGRGATWTVLESRQSSVFSLSQQS